MISEKWQPTFTADTHRFYAFCMRVVKPTHRNQSTGALVYPQRKTYATHFFIFDELGFLIETRYSLRRDVMQAHLKAFSDSVNTPITYWELIPNGEQEYPCMIYESVVSQVPFDNERRLPPEERFAIEILQASALRKARQGQRHAHENNGTGNHNKAVG